jgi:MFS transporter, FHS family, L-fucose permease
MNHSKYYTLSLTIITFIFFVFGFIIWVNGILIPYFQICLELNNFQASLVIFAANIAYFIMALPSAWVLEKTKYKNGMVLGLLIMTIGTLMFIPAAYTRTYSLFLTGLFVTGTGLTLLQAAVNPYIAILGPIESTAQRVGFLGLANKSVGIFSVTVLGSIFLLKADDIIAKINTVNALEKANILDEYALKIVNPYLIITAVLLLMALVIYFSKLPEIDDSKTEVEGISVEIESRDSVFQYPYLVLGVVTMFFASICEVIPVDSIIIYSRAIGLSIGDSRIYPVYALVAMLAGYFATIILIPKYISQHKTLQFTAYWGILLSLCSYFTEGKTAILLVALMGFGTAMLWGTIWGLSMRGLGKYTKIGGAMILMGIIGGAILPLLFGKLVDINPQHPQNAILIMIPIYLVILCYGIWGYKLEYWKTKSNSFQHSN